MRFDLRRDGLRRRPRPRATSSSGTSSLRLRLLLAAGRPAPWANFASNRVWWQGPWGNAGWYDEVRIFARPDVTTSSGAAAGHRAGDRRARVRRHRPGDRRRSVTSRSGAPALRRSTSATATTGPARQTIPAWGRTAPASTSRRSTAARPAVVDPGDATVKMFVKGDTLYIGFDVARRGRPVPPRRRPLGRLHRHDERPGHPRHRQQFLSRVACPSRSGRPAPSRPQDYLLTLVQARQGRRSP